MLLSNIKPPIQEEEEIKQCCRRFFSFSPPTPPHSTVCSVTCTRNGKGCDEWQLTVRESDRRTKCGPAVSRPSARARSHPNQRQAKGNRHINKKREKKASNLSARTTTTKKKETRAFLLFKPHHSLRQSLSLSELLCIFAWAFVCPRPHTHPHPPPHCVVFSPQP